MFRFPLASRGLRSSLPSLGTASILCFRSLPLLGAASAGLLSLSTSCRAEPLTRTQAIDFFKDVPSRNLHGLAARSDGRLLVGPQLRNLEGKSPADLLWCVAPVSGSSDWYVGSGPEGRLFRLSLDKSLKGFTSQELLRLPDSQVTSLLTLRDGSLLAGSSPKGLLVLVREGKVLAQVGLPVDTVLDLREREDGNVLVATGNPGLIYSLDLKTFAAAGVSEQKLGKPEELAKAGLSVFAEVRDRSLRRLALLADGRVLAGSAPRGNLYLFPKEGGAGQLLLENRDAELADFLVDEKGVIYAALTFSGGLSDQRLSRGLGATPAPVAGSTPAGAAPGAQPSPSPTPVGGPPSLPGMEPALGMGAEKFGGRCQLLRITPDGQSEILMSRQSLSVYRMARYKDWLLLAGGEQGDLFGYEIPTRLSFTLSGSNSAQLCGLEALDADHFLILKNNLSGFALLDFADKSVRSAETRRLDLGQASVLGALRALRVSLLAPASLKFQAGVSSGSEDTEGWSQWATLKPQETEGPGNYGWVAPLTPFRGRYLRLKVEFPAEAPFGASLDRLTWFYAPVNHRPTLSEFHVLPPGYALIPSGESGGGGMATLGQLLSQTGATTGDAPPERHHNSLLSTRVIPVPGLQIFCWTLNDVDGDSLAVSLGLRREEDPDWLIVAKDTHDSFAQVDVSHLPEGIYHTRLEVNEEAPRPEAERLRTIYPTDDVVVDRTGPVISVATAVVVADELVCRCTGTDALSLLDSLEVTLNNGTDVTTEQPNDGVRDSRTESFTIRIPLPKVAGATHAEFSLFDANGNRTTQLVRWK